jgi:hypothetical protein
MTKGMKVNLRAYLRALRPNDPVHKSLIELPASSFQSARATFGSFQKFIDFLCVIAFMPDGTLNPAFLKEAEAFARLINAHMRTAHELSTEEHSYKKGIFAISQFIQIWEKGRTGKTAPARASSTDKAEVDDFVIS